MFNIFTNQKKKERNDETLFIHNTRNIYGNALLKNDKKKLKKLNKIKKKPKT